MSRAQELDFDALVALHQQDPAAFEQFRTTLLQDFIASAPPEHQSALTHLKAQTDALRESAASPLEAAAAATSLMTCSAAKLTAQFEGLLQECANNQTLHLMQKLRQPARA